MGLSTQTKIFRGSADLAWVGAEWDGARGRGRDRAGRQGMDMSRGGNACGLPGLLWCFSAHVFLAQQQTKLPEKTASVSTMPDRALWSMCPAESLLSDDIPEGALGPLVVGAAAAALPEPGRVVGVVGVVIELGGNACVVASGARIRVAERPDVALHCVTHDKMISTPRTWLRWCRETGITTAVNRGSRELTWRF